MEMLKTLLTGIILLSLPLIGQIFRLWWRLQRKKERMEIIVPSERRLFRSMLSMYVVFLGWVSIIVITILAGYI